MTDKERLERVKSLLHWANKYRQEGNGRLIGQTVQQIFEEFHIDWLIQQAERVEELEDKADSMAHVIKVKNKEMRELSNFLKKRNIPLKELSPLITVMAHVDFLEKALGTNAKIAEYATEEKEELKQINQRYKQALEFYADEDNYEEDKFNMFVETPLVEYDKGEKARQALKGDKP